MVEAIIVVGWRSDSGAYLVDSYPPDIEIDEQDLTNLFSLHRLAANGVMERAVPDFNFLRLSDGITLVSWYSGFRTTNYIARPDFCVALVLEGNENPNIWEEPLHVICYNVLTKLEDPDFLNYLQEVLETINEGYAVEPLPGYTPLEGSELYSEQTQQEPQEEPRTPTPSVEQQTTTEDTSFDDEFSELLALAESDAESASEDGLPDPFASTPDPFASTPDPFAATPDPFSSSTNAATSATPDPFSSSPSPAFKPTSTPPTPREPQAPTIEAPAEEESFAEKILQELEKLDRTMPKRPDINDKEKMINYLEKKVSFLEAKLNVYGKLLRAYQTKEMELKEKNELIAKLLTLLS